MTDRQAYREACTWLEMFERDLSFAEWIAVMRDARKHANTLRAIIRDISRQVPASPASLRELEVLDPVDSLGPDDPTPPPPIRRERSTSELPIDPPVEMTPIQRVTTDLIQLIEQEVRESLRQEAADPRQAMRTHATEYSTIRRKT